MLVKLMRWIVGVGEETSLNQYLDQCQLQNILKSYVLAYLKTKDVRFKKGEPIIDNLWHLGPFDESHLIKSEWEALFWASICPNISGESEAIAYQAVGSNIQERMLNIIAYLIAKKYTVLPTDKIDLAFIIHHEYRDSNGHKLEHWTSLIARLGELNKQEYSSLYEKYQHIRHNSIDDPTDMTILINRVKNFIIEEKNLILNNFNVHTKQHEYSNWVLPINAGKIILKHFDSIGKQPNSLYAQLVEKSCAQFLRKHTNATFEKLAPISQVGNTCGDWSVYYLIRSVLQRFGFPWPNSSQLRYLAFHTSVENAHEILYKRDPNFKHERENTITSAYERPLFLQQESESSKNFFSWHFAYKWMALGSVGIFFSRIFLPNATKFISGTVLTTGVAIGGYYGLHKLIKSVLCPQKQAGGMAISYTVDCDAQGQRADKKKRTIRNKSEASTVEALTKQISDLTLNTPLQAHSRSIGTIPYGLQWQFPQTVTPLADLRRQGVIFSFFSYMPLKKSRPINSLSNRF